MIEKKHEDHVYDPGIRIKDLKLIFEFRKEGIINDYWDAENSQMYWKWSRSRGRRDEKVVSFAGKGKI